MTLTVRVSNELYAKLADYANGIGLVRPNGEVNKQLVVETLLEQSLQFPKPEETQVAFRAAARAAQLAVYSQMRAGLEALLAQTEAYTFAQERQMIRAAVRRGEVDETMEATNSYRYLEQTGELDRIAAQANAEAARAARVAGPAATGSGGRGRPPAAAPRPLTPEQQDAAALQSTDDRTADFQPGYDPETAPEE